jgi:hypothetical protein
MLELQESLQILHKYVGYFVRKRLYLLISLESQFLYTISTGYVLIKVKGIALRVVNWLYFVGYLGENFCASPLARDGKCMNFSIRVFVLFDTFSLFAW